MSRRSHEDLLRRLAARTVTVVQGRVEALIADRENVGALWRELLARPPRRRVQAVVEDAAFASPGLAHRLLDRAEAVVEEAPAEACELLVLARAIAERLPPQWPLLESEALLGRSRCVEAETRRVRGHLDLARQALRTAFRHLEVLPVGCAERADYCRFLGRLRREEERDDEALALFARAAALYARLPDRRRAGECRLEEAWLLLEHCEAAAALKLFEEARFELRSAGGPETGKTGGTASLDGPAFVLWLSTRQGLALCHADLRREDEALRLLDEIDAGAVRRPRRDRLRALRATAAVEERLDRCTAAEVRLAAAWKGLLEEGELFEALGVLLDRVQLLAEMGRLEEVLGLRAELQALPGLFAPLAEAVRSGLDAVLQQGIGASEKLEGLKLFLRRSRHGLAVGWPAPREPEEGEGEERMERPGEAVH